MQWQHPFTCMLNGPQQSGKTEWTLKFIQHADRLVTPAPKRIFWAYGEFQQALKRLPADVRLSEGLPDFAELKADPEVPKLLVVDDLMDSLSKDPRLTQLFTKGSHHWNCSVIFLVQSLYFGSQQRVARLNCHYIVLMKCPADKLQVITLARTMYPTQSAHFLEAYNDAVAPKFGYLVVDASPATDDKLRLRTNIFSDKGEIVYVSK